MPPADELPEGTDTIIAGAGASADDGADAAGRDSPEARAAAARSSADEIGGAKEQPAAAGNLSDRIEALRGQAGDKARDFVQTGKDRATAALDDVVRMVEDAASEIDSKLGTQYGDYARRAAESIGGFSESFKNKDIDELFADTRELVRKSPGVAVGAAAALGFVVARLVRAGIPEAGSHPADRTPAA